MPRRLLYLINPISDPLPAAIQAIINQNGSCTCEPYIEQYEWNEQTVYVYSCKGPACLCGDLFYDARGTAISLNQSPSLNTFRQEAGFVRNVWSCTL